MPFQKGKPRPKTAGRKKGSTNKRTAKANEAMDLAFHGVGGVKKLIAWGKKNLTEFYRLWGKRVTQDGEPPGGGGGTSVRVEVVINRDVQFYGRDRSALPARPSITHSGEPGPIQNGRVREAVGEDGAGPDG